MGVHGLQASARLELGVHHRQAGAACRSRLNIAWKVSGPAKGPVIREKQIT